MNRYRQYGALDDQPEIVGDAGFMRLNMLADPATLQPGELAVSENFRFDTNGTTVRGGLSRQFPPANNTVGMILAAEVYQPTAGDDQLALVCQTQLVLFDPPTQTLTVYPYPSGQKVDPEANNYGIQAGLADGTLPTFYILRGLVTQPLMFNGNTETVTVTSAPTGSPPSGGFLAGEFALYYQDRIATNYTAQGLGVSNFDDFTTWQLLNQFQILTGGDDYLVGAIAYQGDYVLIGSRKAWHIALFAAQSTNAVNVTGYSGALDGNQSFLRQLTTDAGPVGPKAMLEANGKIWFIGDGAIYAFAPLLDGNLVELGRPISADIQPIMDRMNAVAARGAWIKRWQYRLYFGLPINDEPVEISSITVAAQTTAYLTLPFTLPALLTPGGVATVTTETAHGLMEGDQVTITGSANPLLNGTFTVSGVSSPTQYTVAVSAATALSAGDLATMQKSVTRNNRIAVYNLKTEGWESVDTLPGGIYADFGLVASYGSQKRLWIVDAEYGPALYEQNDADDVGTIVGGITLPFTLPVNLSDVNYATAPIPGHLTSRSFRWGYGGTLSGGYSGVLNAAAANRKVRRCEVRGTVDADTALTLNLLVRTPDYTLYTGTRDFTASQFPTADVKLQKLCGQNGLEAQVDIVTTSGRPTIRSIMVETAAVGRVEE